MQLFTKKTYERNLFVMINIYTELKKLRFCLELRKSCFLIHIEFISIRIYIS